MERILVTGATGQIGSELVPVLRARYGPENVIAAGHRKHPAQALRTSGPYDVLDIRDGSALERIVRHYKIDTIFNLVAVLSAAAEANPQLAWDINMNGLVTVLEIARQHQCAVFQPSSIGAFGPSTPRINTPQVTIQRPNSLYGVVKVAGELLCDYYHTRFGIDTRGLRFPGLISYQTPPAGGTTDYAVHIFYGALRQKQYTCFLAADTRLDMMYMPDAIRAAIEIMEADPARLQHRNAYNISAMSFTPAEIAKAVTNHVPDFIMHYAVDPVRQAIADSWPDMMDDSAARNQWGWRPEYTLEAMAADMLVRLSDKLAQNEEG